MMHHEADLEARRQDSRGEGTTTLTKNKHI